MISKHVYIAAAVGAALTGAFSVVNAESLVSQATIREALAVENLRLEDGVVTGRLVNRSAGKIDNVELLVTFNWLWRDEFNPGNGGPGQTTSVVLTEPLAPGAAEDFRVESAAPLPMRSDGYFTPRVAVVGFTQY
ncbi:MAG: hypothetical protein AB7O21_00770 [Gammaproteobacteria bacterium]